ncbi:MAG TPA: peptide chain release factor H [Flavobacteriia bacterium]|nr:peptide chain release factor H [Flavobacteriia bacterium]
METKIIVFTAGKGPVECSWVVAKTLRIFLKQVLATKIQYKILHRELGSENGTIQSVSIQLEGLEIADFLSHWLGTIQWIGTSTYRKHHKRKNWFIGCYEIESTAALQIDAKDVRFQAMRSSGPGGQHANKVSSAIRAIHQPTGIQVVVMKSRSQHQNKKNALLLLRKKVASYNDAQADVLVKKQWQQQLQLERGNAVQVFRGSDFKQKKQKKTYKRKRAQLKNDLRNLVE